MKTAISIPDDVFDEAEALARRMNKSRSEIYSRAVREYVARHSAGKVTEALDDLLRRRSGGGRLRQSGSAAHAPAQ
ncbi:MAG: ribbon-helix-helix protein, CopG family [Thermoleophilia bacterium]